MLFVRVLTLARGSPSVDVEALPSGKPVFADFFRAPWYKCKGFARTAVAVVFHSTVLEETFLVSLEQMAAETL